MSFDIFSSSDAERSNQSEQASLLLIGKCTAGDLGTEQLGIKRKCKIDPFPIKRQSVVKEGGNRV